VKSSTEKIMNSKKSIIDHVVGRTFHLPGNDMDTDRIIPARFLKCVTFDGLGTNVFKDDRAKLEGKHPFDLPENQGRSILVVDENFGSGSSREHAVVALVQFGIKAIIGLSFAKIFRDNAISYGLVCVEVKPDDHQRLLWAIADRPEYEIEIDLNNMFIDLVAIQEHPDIIPCTMPNVIRDMFVTGCWDMIPTALEAGPLIEETASRLPYMAATAA
jgi:3-isopropylmalate/(R)-2-methylmalate dehydratase small subunit